MKAPASIWNGFRLKPGVDLAVANREHAEWAAWVQRQAEDQKRTALLAKGRE